MLGAGVVFIFTAQHGLLSIVAAIIGVISPSGNEIGPFLSVEQAALSHLLSDEKRTQVFASYNLIIATATGALSGGWLAQILQNNGMALMDGLPRGLVGILDR